MKKYLLKLTALVLLIGAAVGCSEDKVFYDEAKGPVLAKYVSTNGTFPIFPDASASKNFDSIAVQVSTLSNADRLITVSIDTTASSPGITKFINIAPANHTSRIPAGQYNGYAIVQWTGKYADVPDTDLVLVLKLETVQGATASDKLNSSALIDIFKACDYDAAVVAASTYTATVKVDPFPGFPGQPAPSFTPITTVNKNVITVNSLWGPDLVFSLTNSPTDHNQALAPGKIVVAEVNNTLKIVPTAASASYLTGGTGTYDACKNVFTYTLTQNLFGASFPATVTVVLTAN